MGNRPSRWGPHGRKAGWLAWRLVVGSVRLMNATGVCAEATRPLAYRQEETM